MTKVRERISVVRNATKAKVWFVFIKNGPKCYGKVFGFVEKGGKSAQDRARAYAQKLAARNPGKRVYVSRPRVHYTQVAASAARLVTVEI